jgi:hypothetical protein
MKEIARWLPATVSIQYSRREWFLLKRIETTFVSRRRTVTARVSLRPA